MYVIVELKDGRKVEGECPEFHIYSPDNNRGPCFTSFIGAENIYQRTDIQTVSIFMEEKDAKDN